MISRERAGAWAALSFAGRYVLPIIIFGYAFALLIVPLADPDLFWHLRTGQWIMEEGHLPGHGMEDPFAHTTPRPLNKNQVQGLRSQWLGQVVLYGIYSVGGYPGLVVFRNLFILLPFLIVYILALRRGLSPAWAASVVSLPVLLIVLSLRYTFERPQVFTFVMCFALVLALMHMRGSGRRWLWTGAVALMMALWSNLHGGFILGFMLLWLFAAGAVMEAAWKRSPDGLFFLAPAALGTAASMLNPNTYSLLWGVLRVELGRLLGPASSAPVARAGVPSGGVDVAAEILEYKPLWFFYSELQYVWPLFMIIFIALAAVLLIARFSARRKLELPEALALSLFVMFGLYYSRGVMPALMVLPVFMVAAVGDFGRLMRILSGAAVAVLSIALVFITLQRTPWQLEPAAPERWIDESYPEGAVRFIEDNDLRGPMFNDFQWGGYLIWRLHPKQKVFVDGRIISRAVLSTYMFVANARPGALEEMEAFGVNYILIRAISLENGVISPLVLRFLETRPTGWRLVFVEGNSALFVRNTPVNRRVIEGYGQPLEILSGSVINAADTLLAYVPGHGSALLSRSIALYWLGRYAESERVLLMLPPSPVRDGYLSRIRGAAPKN